MERASTEDLQSVEATYKRVASPDWLSCCGCGVKLRNFLSLPNFTDFALLLFLLVVVAQCSTNPAEYKILMISNPWLMLTCQSATTTTLFSRRRLYLHNLPQIREAGAAPRVPLRSSREKNKK